MKKAPSQETGHMIPDREVRFFMKNCVWTSSHTRVKLLMVIYMKLISAQISNYFQLGRLYTNQLFLEILTQKYPLFLKIYVFPQKLLVSENSLVEAK